MENEILLIIRKNKNFLKNVGLKRIGIFGSYSRNEHSQNSDVDLILDFESGKKTFHNYMKTCDFLEKIINKKLDITTPEALSPYIKPYIDKEVIYESI